MREFTSSVLIVGEKPPPDSQLQLDHVYRLTELSALVQPSDDTKKENIYFSTLILPLLVALSDEAEKYIHILQRMNPHLQIILFAHKNTMEIELMNFLNKHKAFHILTEFKNPYFDETVLRSLEYSKQLAQDSFLEQMINENNNQLKNLYDELEVKVQKRQESLLEAKNRAFEASTRFQILLDITESIQKSESAHEIETILIQLLEQNFHIEQAKIVLSPRDSIYEQQLAAQNKYSLFKAPINNEEQGKKLGALFFLRQSSKPFKANEKDFLQKITEIVSLALDRLDKIQQAFERKQVWESTFNAISDPVLIVNKNYEIIQVNQSFEKKANHDSRFLIGKKCYKMLFQRDTACTECELGRNFKLDFSKKKQGTYDVKGEKLPLITEEIETYVHQYHDITEQLKIEKKIMESARLAELGTIGSSIAHELNNPLAGMLSYTQLIKLEIAKDHPLYEDILELESGIKRCRDIIQNLLGFARDPSLEKQETHDLQDIIQRATKIVELQSRAMGIEIKLSHQDQKIKVIGFLSQLTQAIQNLLQRSIQSIIEQMKIDKNLKGIIEIQLFQTDKDIQIKILDNSPAADNPAALTLSIARQILHEHGGTIEFPENAKPFRLAKISLPRPVLQG